MIARAAIALVALLAIRALAQPTSLWVDVTPTTTTDDPFYPEELEKRYTPELVAELHALKADVLLLYTEFSARAAHSLKQFLRNVTALDREVKSELGVHLLEAAPAACRSDYEGRLRKVRHNAHRAAHFSGENHNKFFLGHMIVFRMHLNKTEEYVRKCDLIIAKCGIQCETTPRIKRWRRLAADELNRVRDDLQHSRLMYRDILLHAQRRLQTLRRRAYVGLKEAANIFRVCAQGG